MQPGHRKVKLGIPSNYITDGGVARRVFDMGVLNLETVFKKEERDLFWNDHALSLFFARLGAEHYKNEETEGKNL